MGKAACKTDALIYSMAWENWLFILLLVAILFVSVKREKLTLAGTITAGLLGSCIFMGTGFTGIGMIGLFFGLGILVTGWNIQTKLALGVVEKGAGKRTAGQVIANGGIAGLCGVLSCVFPQLKDLWVLMMAGALSAATADTVSSELGTVYGKRFYNILGLRPGRRGDNGVVSLEGTLLGLAGSGLIGLVFIIGNGPYLQFAWIVLAGTAGNIADSILGASLERKGFLSNDQVNFLNTSCGALTALLLMTVFG